MRRVTAILMGLYLMADLSVGQVQNILNNGGFETGLMCYSDWAWSQTSNGFNSNYQCRLSSDDVVLTYADGSVPSQPVLHDGTRNVTISGQTMRVDGAPYFARGFFDVGYDDLPLAAAAGANTVNASGGVVNVAANCFNTARQSYLDRAYELGLNFTPDSTSTARFGAPSVFPAALSQYAPPLANILWLLSDEPDVPSIPYLYIPAPTFIPKYQPPKPNPSLPIMPNFHSPQCCAPSVPQTY